MGKKGKGSGKNNGKSKLQLTLEKIRLQPHLAFASPEAATRYFGLFRDCYYNLKRDPGYKQGDEHEAINHVFQVVLQNMRRAFTPATAKCMLDALMPLDENGDVIFDDIRIQAYRELFSHYADYGLEQAEHFYKTLLLAMTVEPRPTTYREGRTKNQIVVCLLRDFAPSFERQRPGTITEGLANLYERAETSDDAVEILREAQIFLSHQRHYLIPAPLADAMVHGTPEALASAGEKVDLLYWNGPDRIWKGYARYFDKGAQEMYLTDEIKALNALVDANYEDISILLELIWGEIAERSRRGISPDGDDVFYVDGIAGDQNGHYRYFVPGAGDFPSVGMNIVKENWLGSGKPIYMGSRVMPDLFDFDPVTNGGHIRLADFLANSMAYYKIVTAQPKSRSAKSNGESSGTHIDREQIEKQVRDYLMTLRPGWNPSQEARDAYYKAHGRELPPGKTFVKSFDRQYYIGPVGPREATSKTQSRGESSLRPRFSVDAETIIKEFCC